MRRATALDGLHGGGGRHGGGRDDAQDALARLLPVLVALPLLVLLLRYRATVTRTVVVLADHLWRAATSSPATPLPTRQSPAALAAGSTAGSSGAAEVAARVASRPVVEDADAAGQPRSVTPPPEAPAAPHASPPATADAESADRDSVPGDGSLVCPDDFPVKGNATSKIFHLPGTSYYAMTKANVCFRSPEAAVRAGYRPSKSSPIRSNPATEGGA